MASSTVEHWQAWYAACALGRCPPATADALRAFAHARMRKYARHYLTRTNLRRGDEPSLRADEAWHRFESHMATSTTRGGKRYKDWLFARATGTQEQARAAIESGVTLIIRAITRNWLRNEFAPHGVVSLQTPVSGSHSDPGKGLTLQDLLSTPAEQQRETIAHEHERLARKEAAGRFPETTRRERLVILARALGLPLSHKAVTAAAGCGKSLLSETYRCLVKAVGEDVRRHYPDEGEDGVRLAMRILHHLRERTFLWARSEMACAALFKVARER